LSSNFLPGGINGYTLWNHNQSGCSLHDSHCGAYYLFSSGMDGFLSGSGAIFINDKGKVLKQPPKHEKMVAWQELSSARDVEQEKAGL